MSQELIDLFFSKHMKYSSLYSFLKNSVKKSHVDVVADNRPICSQIVAPTFIVLLFGEECT
jgi:hypothetical protein